ncbi:oligoendopeptidase F [Streptococcus sobrinus]|uniref:oligoendopeptidase F n=1 Tax=Streptococcus sobrinus TaxID=1310 RepID=UPI0002FE542D|nr:oligoendopeptidase F [Streptococcus sobrinus]
MTDNRALIDEKYKWDLSSIFASDQDWEAQYQGLADAIEQAQDLSGHLAQSAQDLLRVTQTYLNLARCLEKVFVYASMKNDQDTTVATYQELAAKATSLSAKYSQAFAFFEPEVLALGEGKFAEFLQEESELGLYRHFFGQIFSQQAHVLNQEKEELLAQAQEVLEAGAETYEILDNADISFPSVLDEEGQEVDLSHGNFITLMESKDRRVRQAAYEAYYSTYQQFQHTYAKTLATTVKQHNFSAKVRHYDSARQAAMEANHIPEGVYDILLSTVHKYLPLLRGYMSLRREILGLDDLKMYDVYTPLSKLDMTYTYEDAKGKALEVLSVFGLDYQARVEEALSQGWIDVAANKGKRSGAYSGGSYDTKAFILLNWQDTLDNLYTLVHEMGHSMHSTFTRENQPYVYGDYSIFLAEIASTTNENIMTETLLKEAKDDKERFALLNYYLDSFKGTVFRQTQFAEFEQAIHEADAKGQVLTSQYLNELYADLNQAYYGLPKEDNPQIQYEWARIPHFYYNFYVYQYATGFAAASYLAEKIVHGNQADKARYLDYLKAGSSAYPLEVIAKAGVDMTQADYLEGAFQVFAKRLEELESLVKQGVHRE